jgi:hypothetical protein
MQTTRNRFKKAKMNSRPPKHDRLLDARLRALHFAAACSQILQRSCRQAPMPASILLLPIQHRWPVHLNSTRDNLFRRCIPPNAVGESWSMSLPLDHSDFRPISLLSQSCLCVTHGGASLQLQNSMRYNRLRFLFLVDAASCKSSPQTLFSMAVRRNESLSATLQSCVYPTADGVVKLTLRLGDQSFSTNIPCGSWNATSLSISDATAQCPRCSSSTLLTSPAAAAGFALQVTVGDVSFLISNDFPRRYFRDALHVGSCSAQNATQPALFRDIFAEVSQHACTQCIVFTPSACVAEPGFMASLPLRCSPLGAEGCLEHSPQHLHSHIR